MNDGDRQWLADRFDQVDRRLDRIHISKGELERRVRALELARAALIGATGVLGAALAWMANHIGKWLP